jgi:hypothetical protein
MVQSFAIGAGAGLVGALHCAAMCGPLAAAQGARRRRGAWRYQVGRTLSYGVIGAVAGGTGQALTWLGGPLVGALVSLSMAAVLGGLAVRLWRGANRRVIRAASALVPLRPPRRPLVTRARTAMRPGPLGMGVLSALLPCGLLWAAIALAAGTGHPASGALLLFGFASASGMSLLAAGWLAGVLERRSLSGRRLLAGLLVAGAVVVAARPIGAIAGDTGGASPPACHRASAGELR